MHRATQPLKLIELITCVMSSYTLLHQMSLKAPTKPNRRPAQQGHRTQCQHCNCELHLAIKTTTPILHRMVHNAPSSSDHRICVWSTLQSRFSWPAFEQRVTRAHTQQWGVTCCVLSIQRSATLIAVSGRDCVRVQVDIASVATHQGTQNLDLVLSKPWPRSPEWCPPARSAQKQPNTQGRLQPHRSGYERNRAVFQVAEAVCAPAH